MLDNETTRFIFRVDGNIPVEDGDQLFAALSAPNVGAGVAYHGAGPIPESIIATVEIATNLVSAVGGTLVIVETILKWRDKVRKKYSGTHVRIERPGYAPIDIMTASDEKITLYFGNAPESDVRSDETASGT